MLMIPALSTLLGRNGLGSGCQEREVDKEAREECYEGWTGRGECKSECIKESVD